MLPALYKLQLNVLVRFSWFETIKPKPKTEVMVESVPMLKRCPPPSSPFSSPSQDPFGDRVKQMMKVIHGFMELPQDLSLNVCGTQEYEADVVILERRGKTRQAESN